MDPYNLKPFERAATEPASREEFDTWIEQHDTVALLEADIGDDRICVYASMNHFFWHAVLVPRFEMTDEQAIDGLLGWNMSADRTWGLATQGDRVWICDPIDYSGSDVLDQGEKLIFLRDFDAIDDGQLYVEMNQKMMHVLSLHHLPERNAWCTIDGRGDIAEVVQVHSVGNGRMVSIEREFLARYAAATDQIFLRMFDVTRFRTGDFSGWADNQGRRELPKSDTVRGSLTVQRGIGSYARGIQLADIAISKEKLAQSLWTPFNDDERQYASFIAHDWRNEVIKELSCDPNMLANYFTKQEGLPFQVTPAFFRPEVLTKYKADTEKYTVESNSISCRGTWYMKGYDVNDAGQIHVYLCDLGDLPYKEQLHWKSFNEPPKAPLSESVVRRDFGGQWSTEYNALQALKKQCRELQESKAPWWTIRDPSLLRKLNYPLTDSRDEWANEFLYLDQLLVESLNERWLRGKAKELGRTKVDSLRALKLVEECLIGFEFDAGRARDVMSPLHTVHNLRSELKGHASGSTAKNREKEARETHGSLLKQFRQTCQDCEESLRVIATAFSDGEHASDE